MRTMRKRVVFAFLILLICAECQELDDGDAGKLFRNETTESTDINTTAPSPNENNSTTVDVPTNYNEEDTQEERETQEEEETRDYDGQADQATTPGDVEEVPEWTTVFPDDDNVISMKDVFEKSLDVVKDEMKGIGIIQSWLKEQANDLGLVPTEDYPTTDDLPIVEEEQQDVYDDDKTGITNFEDFEEKQEETTIPEFDMTTVLPQEIEGEILQKIEDDLEKLNHVHEEEIKEVKKKNEIITDIEKNLNELELISSHEVQETTSILPSTTEVLTDSEELTEVTETDSTVTNNILAEHESKQEMTIPEEEVNTEVMFIPTTESSIEHQTTEFIQETTTIDSVEYSDIPDLVSEERSKSTEEETITENGLTTEVTTSSLDSNIAGEDQDEDLPVDDNHLKKEESLLKEAEEVIEQEEKLLEEQELESQKGQEDLEEEEEEDSTDFIKIVNQIDLEETSGSSEIPKFQQEITTEVTTEITPEMTTELTEVFTEEIVPVQDEIEEEDEEEYKEEEKEEEVKEENDQENEQEEEKEEDIPEITLTSTEMITKTTESEDQNEQNMISTSTTITLLPQTEDPTTKLIVPEITTEQLQTTVYEGVTFVTQTSNVPNDSEDLSTSSTTSSTTTNPDRPTTPISDGHLTTVKIETPNDIIDEIVDEIIDEINILEQTTTTTTEDPTKHLLEETLNLTKTIDHLLEENDQIIKVLTSNKLPENNSKNNNNLKPEVLNDTEEDDEDDDEDLIDFDSDDFDNDDTLQASNDKLPISDSDDWDSSEQDNEDTLEDNHSPKPEVDERVSAVIIDRMDGTICLNASGLSIKITTNNLTYWVPSTARAIGECTSFGAFLNFTWKNKEHEFFENNTVGFKFIGDEEEGYIEEVLFKTNTGILIAQQLERYFTEPIVISLSKDATLTISHANIKLSHKQREYETVSLLNADNALALQIASGGLCLFVVVIAVAIYSYRKLRSQERIFKVSLNK